jgi:hypothetical protein
MRSLNREISCAVATLALLVSTAAAGDKKPVKKPDGDGEKVIVLKLDASKLSPDVLKQLMQAAGAPDKKPDGDKKPGSDKKPGEDKKPEDGNKPGESDKKPGDKTFTLSAAVLAAEKHTQGVAVKAEMAGNGFVVDVKTPKGAVTVTLDFAGKVVADKGDKKPEDKPAKGKKKPGKKKKDD